MGLFLTLYLVLLVSFIQQATAGWCDLRSSLLDSSNGWDANTTIHFPTDGPSFFEVTERWSPYHVPTFSAAISPATESDVVTAVRLARRCKFPFLATGGRHGYGSTMGRLQGGLEIDLGTFNSVSVDREAATLTVGGGTRVGDIVGPVSDAGLEIPVGGCSCPGLVGVTIGAGVNHWQGIHGLVLDSLISVRIVTSDGRLIEASETSNADLFWGIRGAGANFGIITSATYQLYPQTNNNEILIVDAVFPATSNVAYHQALESIMADQPAELSIFSNMIWDPITSSAIIVSDFVYFGPREEGLELLAPVLNAGPTRTIVNVVPWANFYDTVLLGLDVVNCQSGLVHTPYSALVRNISIPTMTRSFQMFADFLQRYPSSRSSSVTFERFSNDGVVAVPEDSTAYPWRDAEGHIIIFMSFPRGDLITEAAAKDLGRNIRTEFSSISGYGDGSDLAVYVNSAQGDEPLESIYGAHKLPRLAALKRTWDPDNVFRYHHGIPTHYP